MIGHALEIIHFITSLTEGADGPVYPQQPAFMDKNARLCLQFLGALEHYQLQLQCLQKRLKIMCLIKAHNGRLEEEEQWWRLHRAADNQESLARCLTQKKLDEFYYFICLLLTLLGYAIYAFYLHLCFLPMGWSMQYYAPVPYQSPLTDRDQQRHSKTLDLSFQRTQQCIKQTLPQQQNPTPLTYLDLDHVDYCATHMVATMKDGTRFTHGVDAKGEAIFSIEDSIDSQLTIDEQNNRRGDFLAVLFYQQYLLSIPDQYHADFWRPANHPLLLNFEPPAAPYHGMEPDHRVTCRALYLLVYLGLEPTLNGQRLTLERLKRENWADSLFGDQAIAFTSDNAMADSVYHGFSNTM